MSQPDQTSSGSGMVSAKTTISNSSYERKPLPKKFQTRNTKVEGHLDTLKTIVHDFLFEFASKSYLWSLRELGLSIQTTCYSQARCKSYYRRWWCQSCWQPNLIEDNAEAKESYIFFFLGANRQWYWSFTGSNTTPTPVNAAHNLLQSYKKDPRNLIKMVGNLIYGIAFATTWNEQKMIKNENH